VGSMGLKVSGTLRKSVGWNVDIVLVSDFVGFY